ncbi:MAG: aminopeptidase [Lachnospiraceae bacterium]|nr:aminopeptidase [Lachnospiraceae bacterium]
MFIPDNEEIKEQYELVTGRIIGFKEDPLKDESLQKYFEAVGEIFKKADEVLNLALEDKLKTRTMEECERINNDIYGELLGDNYEKSYANPDFAAANLPAELSKILCFLYTEMRAVYYLAFEGRREDILIRAGLLMEIYTCFEDSFGTDASELLSIIKSHYKDYSEVFAEQKVKSLVDPSEDYFTKILMESDLSDLRYLYLYGEYIGPNEIESAKHLLSLPEEDIKAMASTYTEGYRIGFELTGKDLSKKKTVDVIYPIGFERVIRQAVYNFKEMGLTPIVYRPPIDSVGGRQVDCGRGAYGTDVNRQFYFDHKSDKGLYFDNSYMQRYLEVLKVSFEKYKDLARGYAGPAVTETFGQKPFNPVKKAAAINYTDEQQRLLVTNSSLTSALQNNYIIQEERSFTIIAYPVPAIGSNYTTLFDETVKLNTLDYMAYRRMQQCIIDVLDTAKTVHVKGSGANETDLFVSINTPKDITKETAFENCVADVNIPVGEVFTSPVLKGTTGVLHVSHVFLFGLEYKNLKVTFKDGMVTDYSCENFDDEKKCKDYIKENVLSHHETLPMGEFAIGTNTTAYAMAKKYDIADRLPILIAEKTGPHFAVGDTCYSYCEDIRVYNPDGREIISKENECSVLRKEDPEKAYFNCHLDITIPFEELLYITAVSENGDEKDIIRDGVFVVPGTEELNIPLYEEVQ